MSLDDFLQTASLYTEATLYEDTSSDCVYIFNSKLLRLWVAMYGTEEE